MNWIYNDGGRKATGYRGDVGDCVARSIAIAADLPYQQVYDDLAVLIKAKRQTNPRLARKHSPSPRTGCPRYAYDPYLTSLGWVWTPTMGFGTGCRVHLSEHDLPTQGNLIVRVSKHITAVVDGVIHDTHDPSRNGTRCVYGYWSKP